MDLKNQLTKTPYLILFMVLISIGVGTASAMITITLSGDVHVTGDTVMDGTLGVGTATPDAALHVKGGGSDFTPNQQGIQLTGSDAAGNVGIEMTGNSKTPYIDFQNDISGTDFDARIALRGDDTLSIEGAGLEVQGDLNLAVPFENDDDRILFDDGTRILMWDESEGRFDFSHDINCPNCIDPSDLSRFGSASWAITNGGEGTGCYVGEVRLFAGNRVPAGWLPAEGQILTIDSNPALHSLLGAVYGGNGITTFGLPDLSDINPKSANDEGLNYVICTVGIFPG